MTDERYGAIVWGSLMMAAGGVLALHSAGRFDARELLPWWPLTLLIPAGQALAVRKGCLRGWVGALARTTASALALLHTHGYVTLRPGTVVPLALAGVGVLVLWRGLAPATPRGEKQ